MNHYPAIVITTAPTDRQNSFQLWGEIRKAYRRIQFHLESLLELNNYTLEDMGRLYDIPRWDMIRSEWYAIGFSNKDSNAFQGFHEINILFIIDEGGGVVEQVYEAIEGSLNTPNSRVLATGNPDNPASYFGRLFLTREGDDWHKIHVSCWETPNVKAGKEIVPGLCRHDWPAERLKKWGEEDPRYQFRVLGNFPEGGVNTLVSYSVAYSALVEDLKLEPGKKLSLGVDVARFGDDLTVLTLREKGWRDYEEIDDEDDEEEIDEWADVKDKVEPEEEAEEVDPEEELAAVVVGKLKKSSGPEVVNAVIQVLRDYPGQVEDISVDGPGVGGMGVYDWLEQYQFTGEVEELKDIELWDVNTGEGAADKVKMYNLRAELGDCLKDEFEKERLLIDSQDTVDQVSQMPYRYNKGQFFLLPKDQFKQKHGGRSPDEMDALALTYAPRYLRKRGGVPRVRVL